jgi:plasmid rolling circle replication initiator protein Rep
MAIGFNADSIPENVKFLQDRDSNGKERPWRKHKKQSMLLSEAYWRIGEERKSERAWWCGSTLEFGECNCGSERKLKHAKFCNLRLCAMCSWRRSRVVFTQLSDVIHVARKRKKIELIHLVLTAKNVDSTQISDELTNYFKSWDRLAKRKAFQKAVLGWFRALEIKHDMTRDSYHPHFHCILAVRPSYFRSKYYLDKFDWVYLWKEAMRLDYEPNVWVERVKPRRGRTKREQIENMSPEAKVKAVNKAIAEVAKYTTKAEDLFNTDDLNGTDLAVKVLDKALKRRRLVAFGGLFKEIHRELRLADVEEADLVRAGEDEEVKCTCETCRSELRTIVYRWNIGYSNYVVDELGKTWQEKREEEELKKKKKKDKGADDHTPERVSEPVIVKKQKRNVTAFDLDAERAAKYFENGGKVDDVPDLATDVAKPKRKPKKKKTTEPVDTNQIELFD